MANKRPSATRAARRDLAHSSYAAGVPSADPKEHKGQEAEAPTPLLRNIDELRSLRDKVDELLKTLHVGFLAFFTDQEEHLLKQRECGNLRPGWVEQPFTTDWLRQPGRLDSLLDSVPLKRYLPLAEREESRKCLELIYGAVEILQVIVGFQEHEPGSAPRLIELRDRFFASQGIDPSKLPPPEQWTVAEAERFAVGLEVLVVAGGKDRARRAWRIWKGLAERIQLQLDAIAAAPRVGTDSAGNVHSDGFRSIVWNGKPYKFTSNQAKVVEVLWKNWEQGTPDVDDHCLREAIDKTVPTARLDMVFRDNPAWGTVIVPGATKGSRRLA